jgi:hypothetical protein
MKKIIFLVLIATFVCKTTNTLAQVNATDSLALVDLYNSTNGPNWPAKYQWVLTNPVNTWLGVGLNNGKVITLFYPGGGYMQGTIPSSIGNLTALTQLGLGNSLSGTIPASIGNLTSLSTLYLQSNQLSGSIPASIGNLKNIEDFDLAQNQLSDSIPCTLDSFTTADIQLFDLSGNAFTFSGMEGLVKAYVNENPVYTGQAKIPIHRNENVLSVSAGGTLCNNKYTWYETPYNNPIATNIGDSTLIATSYGTYWVTITNAIATHLTLTSDPIVISTLPIKLLNFKGTLIMSNVLLQWETGTEINSSHFNIQESDDGLIFNNKDKVSAAGHSTTDQYYSYIYKEALTLDASTLYFRLQETDKDGAISYSNIISIKMNSTASTISVYPNPVKNVVNISMKNEVGNALISLIDINGNKLQQLNQIVTEGKVISMNTSNLDAGTYFILISINGDNTKQKFVKE